MCLSNHLVALRDVTGKQTYPREAQQNDQFELPVSDEDFRNLVRQGQEAAAVISSRENLLQSNYKLESGFDWEGQTSSLHALHFSPDRRKKTHSCPGR